MQTAAAKVDLLERDQRMALRQFIWRTWQPRARAFPALISLTIITVALYWAALAVTTVAISGVPWWNGFVIMPPIFVLAERLNAPIGLCQLALVVLTCVVAVLKHPQLDESVRSSFPQSMLEDELWSATFRRGILFLISSRLALHLGDLLCTLKVNSLCRGAGGSLYCLDHSGWRLPRFDGGEYVSIGLGPLAFLLETILFILFLRFVSTQQSALRLFFLSAMTIAAAGLAQTYSAQIIGALLLLVKAAGFARIPSAEIFVTWLFVFTLFLVVISALFTMVQSKKAAFAASR